MRWLLARFEWWWWCNVVEPNGDRGGRAVTGEEGGDLLEVREVA
jgi:hypothetical protein